MSSRKEIEMSSNFEMTPMPRWDRSYPLNLTNVFRRRWYYVVCLTCWNDVWAHRAGASVFTQEHTKDECAAAVQEIKANMTPTERVLDAVEDAYWSGSSEAVAQISIVHGLIQERLESSTEDTEPLDMEALAADIVVHLDEFRAGNFALNTAES